MDECLCIGGNLAACGHIYPAVENESTDFGDTHTQACT